eukprot:UN33553
MQVREMLWKLLRGKSFTVLTPPAEHCTFTHLGTIAEYLDAYTGGTVFDKLYNFTKRVAVSISEDSKVNENSCIINSIIEKSSVEKGCLVEHCKFKNAKIEHDSVVSCVENVPDIEVRSGLAIQELQFSSGSSFVLTIVGVHD